MMHTYWTWGTGHTSEYRIAQPVCGKDLGTWNGFEYAGEGVPFVPPPKKNMAFPVSDNIDVLRGVIYVRYIRNR